jgi:hypothetical protein
MNTKQVLLSNELGRSGAKDFVNSRADVSEPAGRIEDRDHVRETGNQMSDKFLFLVKAFLDFAPFGDIDQGALEANDAAKRVSNSEAGSEAVDLRAVGATQYDFSILYRATRLQLTEKGVALGKIGVELAKIF